MTTALAPGVVVDGRYEILSELGHGGMGTVYEARRLGLPRRVALKVMQTDAPAARRSSLHKRFLREARIASSLDHPNVVDTIDFGDVDEYCTYYVMELLEGRNLSALVRAEGPAPWSRVRTWLRQVLDALAAAHAKGIIHRDIKPANIMLLDQADEWGNEWVKVLDFGIAKIEQADEESQALTGTSELLGTATHMAPELVRGAPPDARTDLYALGITAYQLLTGEAPFRSENMFKLLTKHMTEPPPPLRARVPGMSAAVESFILRTLEKDPQHRHQSAAAMRDALDALGDPASEPSAEPRSGVVETVHVDGRAVPPGGTVVAPPPRPPEPAPRQPAMPVAAPTPSAAATGRPGPAAPVPAAERPAAAPLAVPPPTTPQHRSSQLPARPRQGSAIPPWMILIPVLAIAAGIAVGLFM